MATYRVDLTRCPPPHSAPALLRAFAEWLSSQRHGSLGWFDALAAREVPSTWDPANAERLRSAGFTFLDLPDGSLLALLATGKKESPHAVVLLGSEGEARTVADSLEELLVAWSKGATGIPELDDGDAADARPALAEWLEQRAVKVPLAVGFDFDAWRDGAPAAAPALAEVPERAEPAAFALLPPQLRVLADLAGRRADDPKVIAFVTNELGAKVPSSATDMGTPHEVKAAKRGFSMWFSHDVLNDAFPLVPKSKTSFVPYVTQVQLTSAWTEELPFDLEWTHTLEDVSSRLGPPLTLPLRPGTVLTWWERELDPGRTMLKVQMKKAGLTVGILPVETTALSSRHGVPAKPVIGLFVAWAIARGLLDASRFPAHRSLIERIGRREERGSALVDEAMPRGLWRNHLIDDEAVRLRAAQMFRNMGGYSLARDLAAVFGERTDEHGHTVPSLDADTWEAVDRATPILDERFGIVERA